MLWRNMGGVSMIFGRKKRVINRLLIVEDEPLIAFDNEMFLEGAGYDVVATVNSAEDAIEVLSNRADQIDAIVLDYNLAGPASGIAVAQVAKDKGIKVLFVTGECPENVDGTAVGCLTKPYTQKHLLAALDVVEQIAEGKTPKTVPETLTLFTSHQA